MPLENEKQSFEGENEFDAINAEVEKKIVSNCISFYHYQGRRGLPVPPAVRALAR